MGLKLLVLLLLCTSVITYRPKCDEKSILKYLKKPTYDFSVRLLDRVSEETDGNFVFSPISTWLQLLALSEGAQGTTLSEILILTGQNNGICFRKTAKEIFNTLDRELSKTIKRHSIFVIDQLLNVKHSFVDNVEALNSAKVVAVDFRNTKESAFKVNEITKSETNGVISESLRSDDFNMSVLLVTDAITMRANWLSPFDKVFTEYDIFYSYEKVPLGYVNMMHQIGTFNYVDNMPEINAQVLELPFSDRASMILFLPNSGPADTLFLSLKEIRLASVLTLLKPNLVNVKMPRFNITTEVDNVPELLHDMGLRHVFHPRFANFRSISDYRVFVSLMNHKANIEVTETGVTAKVIPSLVVKEKGSINVFFNRPFAYLVIDKISDIVLFGGVYSKPTIY